MTQNDDELASALAEVAGAEFGDARLAKRLVEMVGTIVETPSASFPEAFETEAELEGAYRFLNNEKVVPEKILEPHYRQTAARAATHDLLLVVHDSSEIWFRGEDGARAGLGYLSNGHRGFVAHVALAVGGASPPAPLGVVALQALAPPKPPVRRSGLKRREATSELMRRYSKIPPEERRSARWRDVTDRARERVSHPNTVHVMDREADSYLTLAHLLKNGDRFVIRSSYDRVLTGDDLHESGGRLHNALSPQHFEYLREIPVSKHEGKRRGKYGVRGPPRSARTARLHIRGGSVAIRKPDRTHGPEALALNLVEVRELEPPGGEEAIAWHLLTTEPVESIEQLRRVVDIYTARWLIEEYFKALKTGCSLEKRQLTSLEGLLNVLAVLMPIAWRMLAIRHAARVQPDALATVLDAPEIEALRAFSKRVNLSAQPTNQSVLLALAGLGGHLKRNGEPGWQTLAKGCLRFALLYEGWTLRGQM
jgi:hypothetical protein